MQTFWLKCASCSNDMRKHGFAGNFLQHFRQSRLHSFAFTGSENHDMEGLGHGLARNMLTWTQMLSEAGFCGSDFSRDACYRNIAGPRFNHGPGWIHKIFAIAGNKKRRGWRRFSGSKNNSVLHVFA
jgi:hypothetical protein